VANQGQFGKPKGKIGKLIAWMMDLTNRNDHKNTIEYLNIQPGNHVLEIGYGSGRTIDLAAKAAVHGKIVGVDHSDVMHDVAAKRNRRWIDLGKAELFVGDAGNLHFEDESFDIVYSIHCIYFWDEPEAVLKEIYRVLKNKGKAAITVRTGTSVVYRKFADENIRKWLENAGFKDVKIKRFGEKKHKASIILGEKQI
jgi:ubiquinone/menaquinone biosynthesis C-methylase UbiE